MCGSRSFASRNSSALSQQTFLIFPASLFPRRAQTSPKFSRSGAREARQILRTTIPRIYLVVNHSDKRTLTESCVDHQRPTRTIAKQQFHTCFKVSHSSSCAAGYSRFDAPSNSFSPTHIYSRLGISCWGRFTPRRASRRRNMR